jgi:hydroxymethylpyrimidine pyrophosphatase-like HAD family hydrolase
MKKQSAKQANNTQIRLIGMDFDWTLLDHSGRGRRMDDKLIKWLSCFIEDGNYAGIVSGRNAWEMKDILEREGYSWGKPFPNFYIHRESYINIVENGKDMSYEEHNIPTRKQVSDFLLQLGQYLCKWKDELESAGLTIRKWNLYGDFSFEIQMADLGQSDQAIEILKESIDQIGLRNAFIHRNGTLVTILNGCCSGKGNTLLKAIKHFGLQPDQVLAIGDSLNDMTMVDGKMGFHGGCVGNGDELLKKAVIEGNGYIGSGVASEGIKDIIRQLISEGRLKNYDIGGTTL